MTPSEDRVLNKLREEAVSEALADMLAGWRYIREHHGDLYGVGWDRCETKAREALALPVVGGSAREPAQATQVSSDPTANADEPRQADGAFVLTVTATADGHEIAIDHPMGSDAWIKARDAMAAAHAELARHLAKQEECPAKPAARHTETGHECGTCGHHWWGPLHEAPCPACQLEGGKA